MGPLWRQPEEDLGVAVKDRLTARRWQRRLFVPGLAVVIPYRASLFDGGCINDSLRRLTSVDVRSRRNGFEFCKVIYRRKEKRRRWAARRQSCLFVYWRTVCGGNLVNVREKDFDGEIGRQQEGNVAYLRHNGTGKTSALVGVGGLQAGNYYIGG
jgi:hypothetical protein